MLPPNASIRFLALCMRIWHFTLELWSLHNLESSKWAIKWGGHRILKACFLVVLLATMCLCMSSRSGRVTWTQWCFMDEISKSTALPEVDVTNWLSEMSPSLYYLLNAKYIKPLSTLHCRCLAFFCMVRAALVPSLGDWRMAQQLTRFLLLKRAQMHNIPYIKWAYKTTNVSHLISKIRKVMRPWYGSWTKKNLGPMTYSKYSHMCLLLFNVQTSKYVFSTSVCV